MSKDPNAPNPNRAYNISLPAYVEVHADGSVTLEIYLEDLVLDLSHDTDNNYSDGELEWDANAVHDALQRRSGLEVAAAATIYMPSGN